MRKLREREILAYRKLLRYVPFLVDDVLELVQQNKKPEDTDVVWLPISWMGYMLFLVYMILFKHMVIFPDILSVLYKLGVYYFVVYTLVLFYLELRRFVRCQDEKTLVSFQNMLSYHQPKYKKLEYTLLYPIIFFYIFLIHNFWLFLFLFTKQCISYLVNEYVKQKVQEWETEKINKVMGELEKALEK